MALTPTLTPADLPGGRGDMLFSNVGGGHGGDPVITTIYDLHPANFMRTVFDRHEMFPSFRAVLDMFGAEFSRGVGAPTTGHYERDWNHQLMEVGSVVTNPSAAGADAVIALAATDMFDTSVTVGGSARKASYPQVTERILLPDGTVAQITAKNVTTDPHRITLRPARATDTLQNKLTAGDKLFIMTSAHGENTGLPTGKMQRLYEYTNEFQVIKSAFGMSGSALTTVLYPQWQPGDNTAIIPIQTLHMQDFERKMSNALLFDVQSNNLTETDTGLLGYDVDIKSTEGFTSFVDNNGYTITYTPGTYTQNNLYAVGRIFNQERIAAKDLVSWDGYDINVEREQAFTTIFNQTLVPRMNMELNAAGDSGLVPSDTLQTMQSEDFWAWFGFKGATLGGYNYYFRVLHEFSEYQGAGYDDYTYSRRAYYLPINVVRDGKTNAPRGYFGYEWRDNGQGYSRKAIVGEILGAGVAGSNGYRPVRYASSGYDQFQTYMVSEVAFHAACGNRVVLQEPS